MFTRPIFFHERPLCRLSSAMFDKAMMILGDPSDMRQFIRRQEEVAFEDLVWVAVTHCFPQAVLQLYLLFFRPNFVLILHEYEGELCYSTPHTSPRAATKKSSVAFKSHHVIKELRNGSGGFKHR